MSQKTLKALNLALFSLICILSGSATAIDQRELVQLRLESNATVADLMTSTVNGHTGFHFPDTPHFRHFYDITSPRTYDAFYPLNAGRITLGSFIRFIEESPTLFADREARSTYKKILQKGIQARKNYSARTTKTNLQRLHDAEWAISQQLKALSLHDAETQKKTETILSTPHRPHGQLGKISAYLFSWLVLPFRSKVKIVEVCTPITAPTAAVITRPPLAAIIGLSYLFCWVPFLGTLPLAIPLGYVLDVTSPCPTHGSGCSAPYLASWGLLAASLITVNLWDSIFSDAKLAPEPGDGIDVTILRWL